MRLSVKARAMLALSVLGAMIGVTAWVELQPKLRFATRAEVLAAVDPVLKTSPTFDPSFVARYHALQKVVQGDHPLDWTVSSVEALMRQGPVAPDVTQSFTDVSYPHFSAIKGFVKALASQASLDAPTHPDRAVSLMGTGYRFVNWTGGEINGEISYLVHIALMQVLDAEAILLGRSGFLNEHQLTDLISMVAPDKEPEFFRASIIDEFNFQQLPTLPDLGKSADGEARLLNGTLAQEGPPPFGRYDAIQTTKWLNSIDTAMIHASNLAFSEADFASGDYVGRLVAKLPEAPDNTIQGFDGLRKRVTYRWEMNHLENSLAIQMFFNLDEKPLLTVFHHVRTYRELVLGALGILAYKKGKGAFPSDLDSVVKAGYLQSKPVDTFIGRPLHYIPGTTLYSVGQDLKDDYGNIRLGVVASPDFGTALSLASLVPPPRPGSLGASHFGVPPTK